jgi:hypothetical protein
LIETIELDELIATEEISEESTLLEKCKQDLDRRGAQSFHFPEYKDQEESERLENLVRTLDKSSFRRKTATERLEIHYYLREVLTSRGWTRSDKRLIQKRLGNRNAKETLRTARRVYELFEARGIAQLYTVEYIRPTHLIQMKEDEFYGDLIPFARRLKEGEQ